MNDKGTEMLRRMLGEERAREVREAWTKLSPDFASLVSNFLAGEIWVRPNLDLRTRSLVTIAALAALGRPSGLRLNIEMALNNGATREEIGETLLQMAPYAGFPACWEGLLIADEVFKSGAEGPSISYSSNIWIGADPGGKGNFGLAILESDGSVHTCCVDCADEAIQVVAQHANSTSAGVGVDAPLWWSSGRSSDRQADRWLRDKYGFSGGQVQAANSLRGAALVQGPMFVQRMREHFPGVGVTETHPKAVWKALRIESWDAFVKRFSVTVENRGKQEHERDAVISAVAAREGFERRWLNDLSMSRHPSEQDPSQFWLAPIHYFWPEE